MLRRKITESNSRHIKLFAFLTVFAAALTFGVIKINIVSAASCPCNIFNVTPTPGSFNEATGIEVGVKFKTELPGYISGIRFYKNIAMTGTHTASLWDAFGQRIAQATFQSETSTGWQEVTFPPVAVTANTLYTASVYMANGYYAATSNYFTTEIINSPLIAPANNSAGAADAQGNIKQGMYKVGATSAYPTDSFNAGNYWVDVSYVGSLNSDPPLVTQTDPTDNETSVFPGASVTATFDQLLDSSTVTASTFFVKDDQGNNVPGTISYISSTKQVKFISTNPLETGKTYEATLKGGTGTVVKSLDGIELAADHVWSFTVTQTDPCPCTLKNGANPQGSSTFNEGVGVELATKIVPESNGYISRIRFYKPLLSPDTSHVGNIWDNQGNRLATATFTNESDYGWQETILPTPLRVYQDQVYIVSYGSPSGYYVSSSGGLNSNISGTGITAYANNNPINAAQGSGNTNGAFRTALELYPSQPSSAANYYWIDAVFSTDNTAITPLTIKNTQPKNNAYGIKVDQQFQANVDKALNASTVNSSNVRVYDSTNSQVSGTVAYNSNFRQITFTPTGGTWDEGGEYTVRIASAVAALDSTTLADEYVVKFSVGGEKVTNVNDGLGGPILVVTSNSNAYDTYYAEILRAEGITYFDVKDIGVINSSVLSNYKSMIIAEMPLSQSQVDLITSWVNEGGDLVAMKPDKKLAGLLGLQDANSTRTNQYLNVDTTVSPGAGIVDESIQFKGQADNYSVNGARSIALFYSDASTSTVNPAVTTRAIGSKGGSAMAFTYDLARSVIMMRQGNQAWAGQDRDSNATIRANDLFYGSAPGDVQSDWVDLNKVHIPQADEQQRLLVNMLSEASKTSQPMPKFWYLPSDHKAALVFAGDDHIVAEQAGTYVTLNRQLNDSPTNCSVIDWECIRASHYIYADTSISNARAVQFSQLGFEIGDHPSNSGSCNNFTSYASLLSSYTADLQYFRTKFPGLPNQQTSRYHCYVWSDWDSMAKVSLANGIRYSLEYVAFPPAWVNNRSPLMTGSGMNMRLTDTTGAMLDIYQGVTNFDNTAASMTSVSAAFDNAIGGAGYYGIFGSHYDMSDTYDRQILAAAQARNIPTITSRQAMDWLDGRGSSEFANLQSPATGKATFTIKPGQGATGLRAMMPTGDGAGSIVSIMSGSDTIPYSSRTVKGIDYAVFDAKPGDYTVTYSDYDPNPPVTTPEEGNTENGGDSSQGNGQTSGSKSSTQNANNSTGNASSIQDDDEASESNGGSVTSPDRDEDKSEGSNDTNDEEEAASEGVVAWWIWPLGGIPIIGGAAWFILGRLRHRNYDAS